MREQRSITAWTTDDLREVSDEELLRSLFGLSDEASRLHRRSGELALQLDHLATVVGERWASSALSNIEEEERAELEAESAQCNSVCVRERDEQPLDRARQAARQRLTSDEQ